MKRPDVTGLGYVAIGFACLVIATAILWTLDLIDLAPGVAGAIMVSVLTASGRTTDQNHAHKA